MARGDLGYRGISHWLVRHVVVWLGAALLIVSSGAAQSPRLQGHVVGANGAAVHGARILVSGESGRRSETTADTGGFYRVHLPEPGTRFVVSVHAIGFEPQTRLLQGIAVPSGGEINEDFTLELRVATLDRLVVTAPKLSVEKATRWTPGSVEQSNAGVMLRKDPLGSDAWSDLTDRKTGVFQVPGEPPGFSIGGMPPDQTRLSLDGQMAGGVAIPREAVRSVNALTNTFDVSRGRFTGGQLDVETQRGGNAWGMTVRVDGTEPHLQYGDGPAAVHQRKRALALDGGGGGALIRDRAFVFGALTLRTTAQQPLGFQAGNSDVGARFGVPQDSVDRLFRLTADSRPGATDDEERRSMLASGLVRLDLRLSPAHALTARVNGERFENSGFAPILSVPGTGGRRETTSGAALAQLASGTERVANEFRASLSFNRRNWTARDSAPEGVVNLLGATGQSLGEFAAVRFAGGSSVPGSREQMVELRDHFVFLTADGRHRLRLGAEWSRQHQQQMSRPSLGTFYFASLADLEERTASGFSRILESRQREVVARTTTLFVDDLWKLASFQLSYGLRAERTGYATPVAEEPIRSAPLSVSPEEHRIPGPWHFSPRIGFSASVHLPWDREPAQKTEIQGGIGRFVGVLPLTELNHALAEDGRSGSATLQCFGPAVPRFDWAEYRAGSAGAPTRCADGAPAFVRHAPALTVFSDEFGPPRVWRAGLGAQTILRGGVIGRITGSWARGATQPVAFDQNLRREPAFVNAAEGGRTVYVGPAEIDPATGAVSLTASRINPDHGIVRGLRSAGTTEAWQLGASASTLVGLSLQLQAGYTWTSAEEDVGALGAPGGGEPSVGGDPFRASRAPSRYSPRHSLYSYVNWRASRRISIGVIGRLSSGLPFTPLVNGDANGDGVQNDRAFVPDPADAETDPRLAVAVTKLLESTPAYARRCLQAQLGRIARPNSCWSGWSPTLDANARFDLGPRIGVGPSRRLALWVVASNLGSALDYLVHGPAKLRGWGQYAMPDPVLLTMRGFDAAEQRFEYRVNPRFGSLQSGLGQARIPFALRLEARIAVGSDRVVAAFEEAVQANSNRQLALTPRNLRLHLESQLPNIPSEVLALNAPRALVLTPTQALRLQQVADSLAPEISRTIEALAALIEPTRFGAPLLDTERLRSLSDEAVRLRISGARAVRAVVSDEQWGRLPGWAREPSRRFAPFPSEQVGALPD